MKIVILIVAVLLSSANAGKVKKVHKRLDHDSYDHSTIESFGGSISGHSGKGYSVGSGLRSIAQGSADQAHSAVANQHAAAIQASYVAKSTLAQAALQAAATAQAALTGKLVLLEGLEQQTHEAGQQIQGEIAQLHIAQSAAASAKQTAHQAAAHFSLLNSALNNAHEVAELAEVAANDAAAELASQTSMVGKAKGYYQRISDQLNSARIDYEATKEAAEKASSAAHEAQTNAAATGAHASIQLQETAYKKGSSGYEYSSGGEINAPFH